MSFQKIARLRHTLAVLVRANFAQAHRHLISRRFQFPFCRSAPAKGEHTKLFAHEIQRLPQRPSMRVGTKVAAAVLFFEPGQPKARPFFRKIDPDYEESLVVAEGNVVTRPVFLDQFALKQNRFRIAPNGMRLKIPRRLQHGACFQIGLRQLGRQEI